MAAPQVLPVLPPGIVEMTSLRSKRIVMERLATRVINYENINRISSWAN
jgi:hypothetical protein